MMIDPVIAWWGAGLSTLLATVKLYELWRDRFRLDVTYKFTSDVGRGNDVLIRNLSGRPVILEHWELFYREGRWPRHKEEDIAYAEHDSNDKRIDAYNTHTLHFSDENYFSWGHSALNGRRIFIRLHLAGRGAQCRKVYPA
ncbi:hypothetical protein [Solimonas flava]|uniref:hypothetical protein n=1 Tax=Solimonas flava TaxID=415849 RepID=UPI0012B6001A|nr:hypothetical protein [Solimonas flava]